MFKGLLIVLVPILLSYLIKVKNNRVKLGANSYAAFLQFTADSYAQCLAK